MDVIDIWSDDEIRQGAPRLAEWTVWTGVGLAQKGDEPVATGIGK